MIAKRIIWGLIIISIICGFIGLLFGVIWLILNYPTLILILSIGFGLYLLYEDIFMNNYDL